MWGWGFKWSWTADEAHCLQPRQVAAFFLRHCLLFFIHALAVFQILSTSFSRAVIPQLNHFSSEPWPLSCHYTSLSKCKHSSSILFCSHLLSPVYQSFTPLVNALWLTTYHPAETSLAKLALPSLLLTSLDIFSPWPDWHNRNILIPLHFRSLSSHVIYLLSPLRPRLFSILCSLSFLPLPRKCCSLPQKPILHIFIAFKYSLIRINSSTPRTLTPLEKYFQIDIKILFISRLLRFRLWAPALSPINHLSHQGYG